MTFSIGEKIGVGKKVSTIAMLGPLLAMPSGQGLNMILLAILKVNRANWLLVLEKNWSCGKMFILLTRYHYWSDNIICLPFQKMGLSVQFFQFFHCCHLKKWLQQPPQEAAQSWPHGVHLLGLREFADEVHVGIVVDLWIHGISMGYLWDPSNQNSLWISWISLKQETMRFR